MATRCRIIKECKHNDVPYYESIYCHLDGYPKGVGLTLYKHFQDEQKIDELLNLGDISFLRPNIDCPEGHSFDTPIPEYTVAYGRDRGETDVGKMSAYNLKNALNGDEDYLYLRKDGRWYFKSASIRLDVDFKPKEWSLIVRPNEKGFIKIG